MAGDGSLSGLGERFPEVEIVRLGSNLGFAAANNLAARRARGCAWLALLNPDAFPEPGWLAELRQAAARHGDFACFGSRMLRAGSPGALDGTGDVYHVSGLGWRRDHGGEAAAGDRAPREIFSPCAAAALYRRDAFLEAGGFDEAFFCYFEDIDLGFRLRLAGHRCLYVPTAVVEHIGSATSGEKSDFSIYYGHRNLIWTYVKDMPGWLFWLYLPQHLMMNIISVAWFGLRGRGGVLLRAKWDAVRQLPRVWRQRRQIQRGRRVGPGTVRAAMSRGWLRPYFSRYV